MATPRETLKYYFRKYALPTEQQFAELIDAFVHKDEDMLTQEKIDGLTAALQSKVSTETLDQYKAEVQAMIDNATTGGSNISDRLDTAEDNIAGHELRIKALEQAEGVTIDEYLSNTSENPVQNKTVFSALEEKASQTEFQSLKEKIDTFLEDTDATDETINKWKEIESFLQGITDTKTLAGLLSDLKAEIIALIPEPEPAQQGNFVKQVADLDGYSEAQDGEIVQYVGQTSENYTRGFFYERYPEGQTVFIAQGEEFRECKLTPPHKSAVKYKQIGTLHLWTLGTYSHFILQEPAVGVLAYRPPVSTGMPTSFAIQDIRTVDGSIEVRVQGNWSQVTERTLDLYETEDGYRWFKDYYGDNALILDEDGHPTITTNRLTDYPNPQTASSDIIRSTPASWQVIPVGPCVG